MSTATIVQQPQTHPSVITSLSKWHKLPAGINTNFKSQCDFNLIAAGMRLLKFQVIVMKLECFPDSSHRGVHSGR